MLNSINHHKLDQKQTYQVMLTNQESEYSRISLTRNWSRAFQLSYLLIVRSRNENKWILIKIVYYCQESESKLV